MLVLFIVCLIKFYEMYTKSKMARNKCARNSKENYFKLSNTNKQNFEMFDNIFDVDQYHDMMEQNYNFDQAYAHFIQHKTGINSTRGMTDYSRTSPAVIKQKLIKTGLLSQHQLSPQHQQAGFKPKPSLLKQPLSSINSNYISNRNNNNNYDLPPQQIYRGRTLSSVGQRVSGDLNLNESLSSEALKTNVQIVLQNLQNALINSQDSLNQSTSSSQDRFQFLNIFSSSNERSIENNNRIQNLRNLRKMSTSPADCDNTNNNNMGPPSLLGCSFASDFTHDNSDYQWFVDYGYRDGVQHQSILSSLSASYNGIGELSYYEDLAKNIDANLAEVDMENYRREDIHSLLHLQSQQNSINRSKRLHLKDQNEFDNSICKSEILFSPVKESHISVDSLDMDGYADDIILTCQANKDNYTIAFEGSCMYSDESYYDIPENGKLKQNSMNLDNILNNQNQMDSDMTQSEAGYTTWSQLKKSNDFMQMQRYPSGNNNNTMTSCSYHHINCSSVRKSSSMPNLKAILQAQQQQLQQQQQQQHQYQLNVSEVASTSNESSMECRGIEGDKPKAGMLPMFPIPITTSDSNSHNQNDNSTSNNEKVANPPSFNLVKLFIKQKSSSSDTCMDVSSGCWPSDSTNSSTEHPGTSANGNGSNSSLNRLRKKSMNDSGKCSALSKHEEDAEYQLDSLDAHVNDRKTNDFNREIFDSPTHRRNYKDCALNIRKNPLLMNVLNSSRQSQSESSRTSENLTQIFKHEETPTAQMTVPIDMITKSIQTSMFLPSQTETSHLPQNNVKMVPPSFLSQLSKLGSEKQAPVYVIYPNYALPDLGFINKQSIKIQKDVIMSPMGYQVQPKMAQTFSYQQQRKNQVPTRRRPQSLDVEKLQQNQYEHVQDWKSLLTLLPRDYKKLLKNVPEVNRLSMEASMNSQKPMFCMSPPIRRGAGMTCDCHLMANQTINSSSSGGSSQPPSSGYRGSSTMLTDSEMDVLIHGGSAQKLFGEISTEQPRPPPGRKGILRRTNTTTNTPSRVTPAAQKSKRYSMMDQPKSPMQQQKTMTVGEKRRSLQEPNFYDSGLEDYFNNIGGTKNFANRLPNYMKTRDGDSNEKDLNQLMTELELNKALSNKLNYDQQSDDIVDIESKLRAESLLNGIPKSEWKHYAEIASLLELNEESEDRANLRNEVSKVLSSRKVSFNHPSTQRTPLKNNNNLQAPQQFDKKFSTPPNSPQMSQFVNNSASKESDKKRLEKEKQEKIQSNRFKRLQIQWELLSKDAEERAIVETKSGGTTPTGHNKVQSKIPRPVSYPNSRTPEQQQIQIGKPLRSPSRMQTPKKYTTTPTNQTITSPTTGIPRTPNKLHTTPKKTPVRTATRTR